MRLRSLKSELWVSQPRDEVFPFFAEIRNLDAIIPPWLHFSILTPDVKLREGALLNYELKIRGLTVHWQTEITTWEPPDRFIDAQRKGPYRQWIHEHRFLQESGGTLIQDHVEYRIPGWIFEPWVFHLFVGPDLERIFEYRRDWLKAHFGSSGKRPCAGV